MMKYLFLLALVGVITYATIQDRNSDFDFSNATLAERTAYLQDQTPRVRSQLNSGLRQQYGVMRSFSIGEIRLSRGGYVSTIAFSDVPPGGSFNKKFEAELSTALCRSYVKTSSAENRLTISIVLKNAQNNPAGKVILSPATCRAYLRA